MDTPVVTIPLQNLAIALVPVLLVVYVLMKWSLNAKNALYALGRMMAQLLLVGYVLTFIFASDSPLIVFVVLAIMIGISSWIALGVVDDDKLALYRYSLLAVMMGGMIMFIVVMVLVLDVQPWYKAQFSIPIAGMIFANSMNSVSLALERLTVELSRGVAYFQARTIALQTSMIPVINSLFAVGLVSLPGMMTGQILSGVSPLIASRYQIMIMLMIFASSGITTILFLKYSKAFFIKKYGQ